MPQSDLEHRFQKWMPGFHPGSDTLYDLGKVK